MKYFSAIKRNEAMLYVQRGWTLKMLSKGNKHIFYDSTHEMFRIGKSIGIGIRLFVVDEMRRGIGTDR